MIDSIADRVKAPQEILEGLHVLLVSEDEERTLSLRKALLERLAVVGDLQSTPENPVSLRGADVLIVDTRTAQTTQSRVVALRRAGVARWASVVNLDFAKVAPDEGIVLFDLVAQAIVPVTAADRALTERAKREESFSTEILPLGPTRILQALSKVGTTLHVEIAPEPGHSAQLTLSNELLVGCTMQEGGARFEAWSGLARVLEISDAEVRVTRKANPSAMNIMEPLDQALRTAVQERLAAASAKAVPEEPVTKTLVPKPSNPFQTTGTTPGAAAAVPVPAGISAAIAAAKDMRVQPGRTMMGIAPTAALLARQPNAAAASPEASQPQAEPQVAPPPAAQMPPPPPAAAARPPAQAAVRPHGGEPVRGKTIMGIAPGSVSALGAFGVRAAPKPETPVPLIDSVDLVSDVPEAPAEDPALIKTLAPPDLEAAELALGKLSLTVPENSQRELLPTMRAPAPSELDLGYNDTDDESRVERITRPDLSQIGAEHSEAGAASGEEREITTAVTQGDKMEQLMQEAARLREEEANLPRTGSTLGDDFVGFNEEAQAQEAAKALAAQPAPEQPEEQAATPSVILRDEAQEETMYIERPKPKEARRSGLGILLVAASLLGLGALYYVQVVAPQGTNPGTPVTARAEGAQPATTDTPKALNAAPSGAVASAPDPDLRAEEAPGNEAAPATPEPQQPVAEAPQVAPEIVENGPGSAAPALAAEGAPDAAEGVPDTVEGLIKEGARLLGEKNFAEAKTLFASAVQRDAKNAHAQAGLGQTLLLLGQASEAQAPLEAAIRLRARRAPYRVLLGDSLRAQGKLEDARAAWEKALEIDPKDREALKRLAK